MAKSCRTCKHWTKMKYALRGRGLCDKYDIGWCSPNSYRDCKGWESIKYKRKIKHKQLF